MSENINVLVLCADQDSIEHKKAIQIIKPFLNQIKTDLNKSGDPKYYFVGPSIEFKHENICNNYMDKCYDKWKDVKFDVFIEENCPLRGSSTLLSDVIQTVNILGSNIKYFITTGLFTFYNDKTKTWYGANLDMYNIKNNNWNTFQKETNLEVLDNQKTKYGYYYLFKTVIKLSSAKLYKKNKTKIPKFPKIPKIPKFPKSPKSPKRRRKITKI